MCSPRAEIDGRRRISKKGDQQLAMVTGSVLRGLGCSGGSLATGSGTARLARRPGALGGVGLLRDDSMSANRRWPAASLRLRWLGLAPCLRGTGRARHGGEARPRGLYRAWARGPLGAHAKAGWPAASLPCPPWTLATTGVWARMG
jgi:hypothetical protein